MSLPRLFAIVAFVLFSIIGIKAYFKGDPSKTGTIMVESLAPIEIKLEEEIRPINKESIASVENITETIHFKEEVFTTPKNENDLPYADRIDELFRKSNSKLPIVETITYKSKVDWLKGRPAWISDYASYYKTSRHFIARSLNGKPDYFKQNVSLGNRFNVFKLDKEINFYLVIDTTRSKMWFYYFDKEANEKVLLKVYDVGLGRIDLTQASGLLTPLGQYKLGEKIAIYKPSKMGLYNGDKVEMIKVFGTRWIPFEEEIGECTAPAKGLGIHGVPWNENEKGELVESLSCLGKYESDGCIRLKSSDIEELFAIIITKPTFVYLVKDFFEATIPGVEKS